MFSVQSKYFQEESLNEGNVMLNNKTTMQNTPIDYWPLAWLRMDCAFLLDNPAFVLMHDDEKRKQRLPVTEDEMREFIKAYRARV